MLRKSLQTNSDVIIYDLEDSVALSDKETSRTRLQEFLAAQHHVLDPARVAVRVNDITTRDIFERDVKAVLAHPCVRTLIIPKVHSPVDLDQISQAVHSSVDHNHAPVHLVASVESARSLWNIGSIASWTSNRSHGGVLDALLFAAEDYCADTSIIRTRSRRELLYTRSQISVVSKAFGLQAIDMVCVDYKDHEYLREECQDGRELGFSGKQAIHPDQVSIIQSTFVPTAEEILRAAKIVHHLQTLNKGAHGLETASGGKEMIDAPMLKQATKTLHFAQMAGLKVPEII